MYCGLNRRMQGDVNWEKWKGNYSCALNKVISMFLIYVVQIPYVFWHVKKYWYMVSEEIWNWYQSFLLFNWQHSSWHALDFFFANQSILEVIQNIETQFGQKPIYFVHRTWLKTIAEIPIDIILITVEYKYANYITFQIWFRLLNSRCDSPSVLDDI